MLPSELLFSHRRSAYVYPRFLEDRRHPWAEAVLQLIQAHHGKTRGELAGALRALEGDSPDYRLIRGFAHLVLAQTEFQNALAGIDPAELRRNAFTRAARLGHDERHTQAILAALAEHYRHDPETLVAALYADLPERQLLTALPDFTTETLVDRYNLAQAQGLLYSASSLRVTAHRNVPGEYRRLFQQLKFYGLLYAVEGNLDDGYQIYVDGPASLFRQTRKYGLNMAAFLPALLRVSRWQMDAVLTLQGQEVTYRLTSDSPLRSHLPPPPAYDSLLERAFAERWNALETGWTLEREVEIVDLKGTVFVPDFALRDAQGRVVHIEIVGFWHPDYLRRKLDKVKRARMDNLILAVSDRLQVSDEALVDIPGPIVMFKGKLEPKAVLECLHKLGEPRYSTS